ncbi:hypothetical protein [Methylocapsa aurea]|uniref:hypothetical protein n=1 Tax=Methylocapsa aurea TaxID=663610 RepID=UPI000562EB70|nr:hypothetical protein [Methylocapsa aurea]
MIATIPNLRVTFFNHERDIKKLRCQAGSPISHVFGHCFFRDLGAALRRHALGPGYALFLAERLCGVLSVASSTIMMAVREALALSAL